MATHAGRSADLSVIDAVPKFHHGARRSGRNGQRSRRSSVGMRAFRWHGRGPGNLARTGSQTRARRVSGSGARPSAAIDNAVDAAAHIIGHVQCTVGTDSQTTRAMIGFVGSFDGTSKTVRENLALARVAF